MKAAMLSYNTFRPGEKNGWKFREHAVLLLQNTHGIRWGADDSDDTKCEAAASEQYELLMKEVSRYLSLIDVFVLYLGGSGTEKVMELAQKLGIDASKIIFATCDCHMDRKLSAMRTYGFEASRRTKVSCGGQGDMETIYRHFLKTGHVIQW